MRIQLRGRELELLQGDITDQQVDAIVNAANSALAGGGGVDGAVHRRGGPEIMEETRRSFPDGCPTGEAVITAAGNLPCRHVVHAVGPIWHGGGGGERQQLESAYRRSLELACQHGCASVALPALSAGAYGYPLRQAATAALRVALDHLRGEQACSRLVFVLFQPDTLQVFREVLEELCAADDECQVVSD